MSAPTEPGWYWVTLNADAQRLQGQEVAHYLNGRVCLAGDDGWYEPDDVLIWGPRIPDPKTLERWRMIAENTHPDWDSPPMGGTDVSERTKPILGTDQREGVEANAAPPAPKTTDSDSRDGDGDGDGDGPWTRDEPHVECLQCGGRWLSGEPEKHFGGCG